MSIRSRNRSPSVQDADFDPLQAFLLKNTTVYAYPRQRRRPRHHSEDVDSVKAICQRVLYFLVFYAILGFVFIGYLNWYMYFQVGEQYFPINVCKSPIGHLRVPLWSSPKDWERDKLAVLTAKCVALQCVPHRSRDQNIDLGR